MSNTALTQGAHHIGLTVPDLNQTRNFFLYILGFNQIGEVPSYPAAFVTDGVTMITLWQASDPSKAIPFDRKNVIGLHHLALKIPSQEALDQLYATLVNTADVEIEFAPQNLGDGPTKHMMIYIPGGIRVELIAPAS